MCPTIEIDESIRHLHKNVSTLLNLGMRWPLVHFDPGVMRCSSGDGATGIVQR